MKATILKKMVKTDKYPAVYEKLLKLDYDIGHYPFLVCGKKTGVRKVYFKGGYWEFNASVHPTWEDGDVLFGLLKAFQYSEAIGLVQEGKISDSHTTKAISLSKTGLAVYSGKKGSGPELDFVYEALKRLTNLVAYKYMTGEKRHSKMVRFVVFQDWDTVKKHEQVTISMDANFLKYCETARKHMFIQWRKIQELKGDTAKALAVYLATNNEYETQAFPLYYFLKHIEFEKAPRRPEKYNPLSAAKYNDAMKKYQKKYYEEVRKIEHALTQIMSKELITGWKTNNKNCGCFDIKDTVEEVVGKTVMKEKPEKDKTKEATEQDYVKKDSKLYFIRRKDVYRKKGKRKIKVEAVVVTNGQSKYEYQYSSEDQADDKAFADCSWTT